MQKKAIKKVLGCLCAFALMISMIGTAFAAEINDDALKDVMSVERATENIQRSIATECNENTDTIESAESVISSDIQDQMLRILTSVEEEKEHYGLSDLNFSAVQLGDEIPTYKVSDGKFVPADIKIIPITDGTDFLSFFYVANDVDGFPFVQLSNELISPLQNFVNGDPFSIIYDEDGAYVYVDGNIHLLGLKEQSIYTVEISEYAPIKPPVILERNENNLISVVAPDSFADLTTRSCTKPSCILNVSSFAENISIHSANAFTSKYLYVDKIPQPEGTKICWAICIASIANYLFDGPWTYTDIVQMFNSGVDSGMYTENVISNFNYYFGADWGYNYTTKINPDVILSYLLDDYPLYSSFTHSKGAHAVVIRGVSTTQRTFSVMNPTPTTTGYTTGSFSSNNTLSFVGGYSGATYTLESYAFPMLS